jgi:hypothetical protein
MPTVAGIPSAPTDTGAAVVPDFTPSVPRNYGNERKSGAVTYRISALIMPILAGTILITMVFL